MHEPKTHGVKPLPEKVRYLRVKWDGEKPKQTKGGGIFREKSHAISRRNNLLRRWPDKVLRATIHFAEAEWQEYTDWMDPDLKIDIKR